MSAQPTTLEAIFSKTHQFFSSFFRIPPDKTRNVFTYTNDSENPETARMIFFPAEGIRGTNWKVIEKDLPPHQSIIVTSEDISALLGGVEEGTVLLCLEVHGPLLPSRFRKEFVSNWFSSIGPATRGAMTSSGSYAVLNTPETKSKKSFFMFSPVCYRKGAIVTENILTNHSTNPLYDDHVDVFPTLCNLKGEVVEGKAVHLGPFGRGIIDIEKVFGRAGIEALERTGGYGFHRIASFGHIFVSYYFQLDWDGNFLCGNHTQPPQGILKPATYAQIAKEHIKRTFPFIFRLRNIARSAVVDAHG